MLFVGSGAGSKNGFLDVGRGGAWLNSELEGEAKEGDPARFRKGLLEDRLIESAGEGCLSTDRSMVSGQIHAGGQESEWCSIDG